jgi:hypothetical protein
MMDTTMFPVNVRADLVDEHIGDPVGLGAVRPREQQDRAAAQPGQVGHEV